MRLQHVDKSYLPRDGHFTKRFDRQRMGDEDMVAGLNGPSGVPHRRGMDAVNITVANKNDRLVKGGPQFDARAKTLIAKTRVLSEGLRRAARLPAAFILKRLGKIPVVQGNHRLNVMRQQFVNQVAVELHTRLIHHAAAGGQQAGP